jgi:hypothetical protein
MAPQAPATFFDDVSKADTVEQLQELWEVAKTEGYADFVRKIVTDRKAQITGGKK